MNKSEKSTRTKYESPIISSCDIRIEHSIANGSATVVSPNSSGEVQQEWENGDNIDRELLW